MSQSHYRYGPPLNRALSLDAPGRRDRLQSLYWPARVVELTLGALRAVTATPNLVERLAGTTGTAALERVTAH